MDGTTIDDVALDQQIERAQRHLRILCELKQLASEDPQLLVRLLTALRPRPLFDEFPKLSDNEDTPESKRTYYQHIVRLFQQNANAWMTVSDIRERVGIPRGAIANVLYKINASEFDRMPHPRHKKMRLWRLKDAGRCYGSPIS